MLIFLSELNNKKHSILIKYIFQINQQLIILLYLPEFSDRLFFKKSSQIYVFWTLYFFFLTKDIYNC